MTRAAPRAHDANWADGSRLRAVVLRPRRRRKFNPVSTHATEHFLARAKQYPLTEAERADRGLTSPEGHAATRRREWMRKPYRGPVGFAEGLRFRYAYPAAGILVFGLAARCSRRCPSSESCG